MNPRIAPHRQTRAHAIRAVVMALTTAVVCGSPLVGCEPRGLLTQAEFAGPVRAVLVQSCCDCLAGAEQDVPTPLFACAQDYPDGFDPALADAGVPQDGLDGRTTTRCLCDDTPRGEQCADDLNEQRTIALVGRCIEPGGVCESACDGVLAFPE